MPQVVFQSLSYTVILLDVSEVRIAFSLQNIDVQAVTQLSGDSGVSADVALAQAQIAFRRPDYVLAQRHVAEAAPALDRPDAEPSQRQLLQERRKAIDSHLSGPR